MKATLCKLADVLAAQRRTTTPSSKRKKAADHHSPAPPLPRPDSVGSNVPQ